MQALQSLDMGWPAASAHTQHSSPPAHLGAAGGVCVDWLLAHHGAAAALDGHDARVVPVWGAEGRQAGRWGDEAGGNQAH